MDLGKLTKLLPDYLSWRFKKVGSSLDRIFEASAVRTLADRAQTPQLAGILAIRAMREAFLDGARKVGVQHAMEA